MATPYREPYPKLRAEQMVGRDGNRFIADDDLLAAAHAALALERPLLLTGEPGCGKTDFAFAAASGLAAGDAAAETPKPLEQYVRSDTRARDLLYHYDAVRRFGDSQTGGERGRQRAEWPQNYIVLEPLGEGLMSPVQQVVLIDEIDKAPRDLPNDLLRELDQGWFDILEIPPVQPASQGQIEPGHTELKRRMERPRHVPKPLVVITSNVERQLPDAFLRRCVFFYIPFPSSARLRDIVAAHIPEADEAMRNDAVTLFSALRDNFRLTKAPATAELLDWVKVLTTVYEPAALKPLLAKAARELEDWASLPAMGCLLKLRDDFDRVVQ
ncbi:MAG: hypothetical protein ETSY1_08960 [Candidatus Entotheonella factor]|uniref:ATPase dynein-related AAA domain-containing protein n=1 Tax=Entotheonella factor TaxID=1429438 RepID=W4LST7_ENTF1|nr:MoxR family ATPase [Candidatus Entotheonella palauensis]ETX01043.1 MAG: hypothetical protein ETSY1_08960 [Candidatus Entotheonella factor]